MSLQETYMMRPVRRILEQCLALKPGENLLVLTDTNTVRFGEPFVMVGMEMGADAALMVMQPRTRHGEELPSHIAEAMRGADAIVAPTTFSVNHTQARFEASKAGARLIFMPDVQEGYFRDGSLDIDFLERKQVIDQVAAILEAGSALVVRTPGGSHLSMSIAAKHAVPQSGICHEPGSISPPPCIEVAIAPDEGTTNGVLVVDGSIVPPGGVMTEPATLTFEGGRITRIEGGQQADLFREMLDSFQDPNMYCPVEMGLGMNPQAMIGRSGSLEDEAELGTMHIGIGNGITFGSSIRAAAHCDVVARDAEIEVDGKILMKARQLFLDGAGVSGG